MLDASNRPRSPRFRHLTALACALVFSAVPGCGGMATGGDGGTDPGNNGDAGSTGDTGATLDSGAPADTGSSADAGRPECDSSVVTCRSLPPPCPTGQVPVVAGNCWAGHCVRASICRSVKDCTACNAATDVCALDTARGAQTFRCSEVPAACASDRTCRCLASFVCTNPPFVSCSGPTNGQFSCTCPNC
jgi:hypothetical protein